MNEPSAAHKMLRLACVFLSVIFPIIAGVAVGDETPIVLHWQMLGESAYKSDVLQLMEPDLIILKRNGHDPLKDVYVATGDLNNDGRDELFVTSGFQPFSGIEGGWVGLYSPDTHGEYREIHYAVVVDYSPRILPSMTNGFRDLAAWNSLVKYEAGAYRRTKEIDPAQYDLGKELSPENLLPQIWKQCCSGRD